MLSCFGFRTSNFEFMRRGVLADKMLYPEMIERLPDIDIPNPGVRGKLFQGEGLQAVFFSVETPAEIAPHQHQAQWGVVLEGELLMTVDGVTLDGFNAKLLRFLHPLF